MIYKVILMILDYYPQYFQKKLYMFILDKNQHS